MRFPSVGFGHVVLTALLLAVGGGGCMDSGAPLADGSTDGILDRGTQGDSAPDWPADLVAEGIGPSPIKLPDDEAPHQVPVEWWYYTGRVQTGSGERYGLEFVVFQAQTGGLTAFMGHFAVTDQTKGEFHLASDFSIGPQFSTKPGFDLALGTWKMSGHAGQDQLSADMEGYAIDLALTALKPVVLQYGNGVMTVGSTNPFYYYSYTQMQTSGTLTVDGVAKPVTGLTWMDHQWGDLGSSHDGWDWYSLRLEDNTEVMIFIVRRQSGDFVGGTAIDAAGSAVELKPGDFMVSATGQWKSTHTTATYPQGWTISIPSLALDVTISPVLQDQEFYHSYLGSPIYWEGLCDVSGTKNGQAIGGHAYVELTGYDS